MYLLKIKLFDWFLILIFGILFGTLFGLISYILATASIADGAILGAMNGFFIALGSFILISITNKYILVRVSQKFWNGISFVMSSLSGIIGSLSAIFFADLLEIKIIDGYSDNLIFFTLLTGLMTYLLGFVFYLFVKSRNKEELVENKYKQSRLNILQSQLNPHFLFNSLNTIAELVYVDQKKAEFAIIAVSKFLRSTLDESLKVSLKNELDLVQNYVNIENIRFNNSIHLSINSNNLHLDKIFLPKFSLQLLVENAIKHNNVSKQDLSIVINISKMADGIIIEVADNGAGFEQISYGTGLKNLLERLIFLNRGELVQSSQRGRTTFTITLRANYENISY